MRTFENYLREQIGLNYYDCRVLNVDGEEIRNLFADWIKKDTPNSAMVFIALEVMHSANVTF